MVFTVFNNTLDLKKVLRTPIDYFGQTKLKNKENYRPILVTGGRSATEVDSLDATLLEIPFKYLVARGKEKENGAMTLSLGIAVLKPDFTSAKDWRKKKGDELRAKYPEEEEFTKRLPKKRKVSPEAWAEYRAIVEEYDDRVVRIGISAARDIYSLDEMYQGGLDFETKKSLSEAGEYFGPIDEYRTKGRLERTLGDTPISFRVGKYGQGLWKYKDGIGRDFIQEEGNPESELWEYGYYAPAGVKIPKSFYYVPIKQEQPHNLYIECGWNGNIDYLRTSKCSAKSLYDNTIMYSFSFRRDNLVNYKELNKQVRKFITSLILEKSHFSDVLEARSKLNGNETR